MSNVNRGSKKSTDSRASRAAQSDSRVDRKVSDDERLIAYRNAMYQSALPQLPEIDGYHTCWLTTTNPRDPIHGRLRLGYELLKPEELGGIHIDAIKTGEHAGCIGVNEMVAAKLPMNLYQGFMAESGHHAPAREEARLRETAESIKRQAENMGGRVSIGDGMAELPDEDSAPPEPDFY
jgi:hypothetical protein